LEELQETKAELESSIESLQEQEQKESAKLDKAKVKIQKQETNLEYIEQIEAKPIPLSSKVAVEKMDFDSLKSAAKKYVVQEKKESKLRKALDAAKKMIADLTAELKALKAELTKYKSVIGKLDRIGLKKENDELKSELRQYKAVIERHDLWNYFGRHDRTHEQTHR